MNLGKNIKKFRVLKKMTQEDLAELLNTTSKSVSRWESDITFPDITMLPLLANIFEVTVDELLDVEKIKQEDYLDNIKKQALEYRNNNNYNEELTLWADAYKKFPNNEEVKLNYISLMNTINIMSNELVYKDEIIKIGETILEKSLNNFIRLSTTNELVQLYSMMDNIDMADFYAKTLPIDYYLTYDVMKTRYLRGDELLKAIQWNVSEFLNEITREIEFIIDDNRMNSSNEYKKEILEKLLLIEQIIYCKDDDYGYSALSIIFGYIKLSLLEIKTSNDKNKVLSYFKEINKAIKYIISFKTHIFKSPFMNKLECKHIGSYIKVLSNLKININKHLNNDYFIQYKEDIEYKELIENINQLK